jgi:hypothetical protein
MEPIKSVSIPIKRRRDVRKAEATAHAPRAAEGKAGLGPRHVVATTARSAAKAEHLYRVGQRLRMLGGGNRWARVESLCEVVVLLPYEGGALMYRVRSEAENYERVVAEVDLQPIA